MFAEASN